MNHRLLFTVASLLAMPAFGQDSPSQSSTPHVSISGIVKDSVSGKPLANYSVATDVNATWVNNTIFTKSDTKEVKSMTDESGHYKLSDLPPGHYRIMARDAQHPGSQLSKNVILAGQDLEGLDFPIVVSGTISGKVVDENKEPVPGMTVLLVSKEYYLGSVGYFMKSSGRTNDRGEYKISRVEAGHPYLLVTERRPMKLPARAETPLNPKLRRPVPIRTWYLDSPVKEGAVTLTLRPGENREGVDIEVKKSPSYCIDGILSTPVGPAALRFEIEAQQPSSGISNGGGMFMAAPNGMTGLDGKFRICDLYPGDYRLTAMQYSNLSNGPPPYYSVSTVTVSDRDLNGLRIDASEGLTVNGEVVLDGPQPNTPITDKISVSLQPRLRGHFQGEHMGGKYSIPGTFSWKGLLMDDYAIWAFIHSPGLYVKDVTYADRSVSYEALRLGTQMGNAELKVIIAQDGSTMNVTVADKDGNPVPDTRVALMPAEVASEGILAAKLITGQTDQLGQYTSPTLAPGKYFVAANIHSINATEENIDELWKSRNHFTEVILPPSGSVSVSISPLP